MTQTQTQSRLSRGWSSLVGQITAADSLEAFNRAMLDLQCKVVAAEYGGLWIKGPGDELRMAASWPENMQQDAKQNPVFDLLQQSAKMGFERSASHVLKVAPEGADDPPGIGAHVFVTVLKVGAQIAGVTTVVADCRDPKVLQSTLPLRELGAGLYEIFFARKLARDQEAATQQVRNAMALLAVSQDAQGWSGACLNLVNELARQLKCTRVSLGWVRGRNIKLVAMSDTEDLKRHSETVLRIEMAMGECLDQQQPLVFPLPPDAEPLLAEAVVHAHRQLIGSQPGRYVLSVPLRRKDEWIGVITLERMDEAFDSTLITQLQLVADVVAPHLEDRRNSDRILLGHAWQSVEWAARYLVGPKHIGWKLLSIVLAALFFSSFFVSIPYRVGSEFTLEADSRRIVPAPYEGDLAEVFIRPGTSVNKGDVLAKLNATDLKLQLAEARSQLRVQELAEQKARDERKYAEVNAARANIDQIQARIQLLEYQVEKATIRSPIAGVLLHGDWYDKVGGVVKTGEPMFEIAPIEDLVAVLRVHERDIDQIQRYVQKEGRLPEGKLATRSQPEQKFRYTVRQIVPLAGPVKGENVFEVRTAFNNRPWSADTAYEESDTVVHDGVRYRAQRASGPETPVGAVPPGRDNEVWARAAWLRPGMEGIARTQVEEQTLFWIASHRVTDTLRLWLWW